MPKRTGFQVHLLGDLEIIRDQERLTLPQSRKTRALFAYLVVTGRPHSRKRLCSLFWDVTDDPRGALRWSLSKLRALVSDGTPRLITEREQISFDANGVQVDFFAVQDCIQRGLKKAGTSMLEDVSRLFRGPLLETLDLPGFHEYQAWLIAQREQARLDQLNIFKEILGRLEKSPQRALPYAREMARIDPLNESAHARLVELLAQCGREAEAGQQYKAACRLLKDSGVPLCGQLQSARDQRLEPETSRIPAREPPAPSREAASPGAAGGFRPARLAGRKREFDHLLSILKEVQSGRKEKAVLLTGEPGVGKTRLMAELQASVLRRGGTVLAGCAWEAEQGRPYGAWIDALRGLPAHSITGAIGTDLAILLPELPRDPGVEHSRNRLFGAVAELIAARAHSSAPVLLGFDDIQWFDADSAELLHYTARMNRHRPVMLAMAARAGELALNESMRRVISSLGHDPLLEEIRLGPLKREEVDELVHAVNPAADPDRVFALSAGNPLFAVEIARSIQQLQDHPSPTLTTVIRERIDRLQESCRQVLRWSAVIGPLIGVRQLAELTAFELGELMAVLEFLEQHGLLLEAPKNSQPRGDYVFAHDIVRETVYSDISEPRRRLMHLRIAQLLNNPDDPDETIASEVARHAALGGNFSMAAAACVSAGRRCLRLFAGSDAVSFADRGLQLAERLSEPERSKRSLELIEIRLSAHRPDQTEEAVRTLKELAERALDHGCHEHARLGFHMLGYLHWEEGDWSGAKRDILRAEIVSREADEKDRAVAMAEAARCLALLERDLATAEALALQASALCARLSIGSPVIPDAAGMLRLHEGKLDEAAALFQQASLLAKNEGNRLDEFRALEHLFTVELQRGHYQAAAELSSELVAISGKLREGSEAGFAGALAALSLYAAGDSGAASVLQEKIGQLRVSDAKHRLSYVLTRTAEFDLRSGNVAAAAAHAQEALKTAKVLELPSEIALAHCLLARVAGADRDEALFREHVDTVRRMPLAGASHFAREAVRRLVRAPGTGARSA